MIKSQITNKIQKNNFQAFVVWNLEFVIYLGFGAWDLEFPSAPKRRVL